MKARRAEAHPVPPTALPQEGIRGIARAALPYAFIILVTVWAFWPVLSNGFVNWDDPDVLIANAGLQQRGGALVEWAFSTRHMGHYQPLSWLTLAWLGGVPPDAWRVHAASLMIHALNSCLLFWCCAAVAPASHPRSLVRLWAAAAAALLFALHPLRVEPVAWASAFPYLLSYAFLLASVACWLLWCRRDRPLWLGAAVVAFGLSQLARVTAPLMPLVLMAIALVDARAVTRKTATLVGAIAPFALVSMPLTVVEAGARSVEDLATIGLAPRVASGLTQPALYLWRTMVPSGLTPLDPLPRVPVADWGAAALAVAAFGAAVGLTWRLSSARVALVVWGSYLLLLLPVLGLVPSGLQATADRYTYGPAMVLSVAFAAGVAATTPARRRVAYLAVPLAAVLLAVTSHAHTRFWHDSISLWSRAVALNADNDVALYNLAVAFTEAGHPDMAIDRYQRLIALVPDHGPGQRGLAALLANREQGVADAAATAGRLADAVAGYNRALQHDPDRTRARANRGMALVGQGELSRGAADLEAAVAAGIDEPAIVNALSYAWTTTGRSRDAIRLLTATQAKHTDEIGLANNLARLLLIADPPSLRDPAAALDLAKRVNETTGGNDPRLLDTLSLALAASGHAEEAEGALRRAIDIARQSGDAALVVELSRRRGRR